MSNNPSNLLNMISSMQKTINSQSLSAGSSQGPGNILPSGRYAGTPSQQPQHPILSSISQSMAQTQNQIGPEKTRTPTLQVGFQSSSKGSKEPNKPALPHDCEHELLDVLRPSGKGKKNSPKHQQKASGGSILISNSNLSYSDSSKSNLLRQLKGRAHSLSDLKFKFARKPAKGNSTEDKLLQFMKSHTDHCSQHKSSLKKNLLANLGKNNQKNQQHQRLIMGNLMSNNEQAAKDMEE